MDIETKTYRGIIMSLNPMTDDWIIDLKEPYGAYSGSVAGIKGVIDRYHKSKEKVCDTNISPGRR